LHIQRTFLKFQPIIELRIAVVVQHFTDMQEPSGIERRDMAITNNTPGEALWTRGYPTEDHQIHSGN
jgi:hypothetical protein